MIRHTPEMFKNSIRHVKIGFHDTNGINTFYLTASTEVGNEHAVAATEVRSFKEIVKITIRKILC